MEAMDGQVYEKRKKGGWRVWEILKRGAIGRWVGEVRGGRGWGSAEILKREKWSRNKGIVCLCSPLNHAASVLIRLLYNNYFLL